MTDIRQVGRPTYDDGQTTTRYEASVIVQVSERVGRGIEDAVTYETEVVVGGVTMFTHRAVEDYVQDGERVAEDALRAWAGMIRGGPR